MSEAGTEVAFELWDTGAPVASSVLVYPESRAALAAARLDGRLTAGAHSQAVEGLGEALGKLLIVQLDGALAEHAGQLADEHALRGYDAVHLASALTLGLDTQLVTWDRDLSQAAQENGLGVAPAP